MTTCCWLLLFFFVQLLVQMFVRRSMGTVTMHLRRPEVKRMCKMNETAYCSQSIIQSINQTLTGLASSLILPHETASSGLAPASLPSYSLA